MVAPILQTRSGDGVLQSHGLDYSLGFRILWFRIQGLGFGVRDLGFRVQGSGMLVQWSKEGYLGFVHSQIELPLRPGSTSDHWLDFQIIRGFV